MATSRSYQYDLDGNRTQKVEGSTTTAYTYDRADQLATQVISGTTKSYDYDRYGNLTSAWDNASAQTTYAYDEANRLTTIAPPGGAGNQVTFTIDALDRHLSRSVGGTTADNYGYVGASETAWQVGNATTTGSLLDADGSRLAVKTGSTVSWLLFDLHGSVAAMCPSGSTTLSGAYRYDGFGQQIASSGSITNPWRYRGLLNLTNDFGMGAMLDMGARDYAPELGVFTQEDSVEGGAANPMTMNRFLYALANPATLIDPDGHLAIVDEGDRIFAVSNDLPTWKYTSGRAPVRDNSHADEADGKVPMIQQLMGWYVAMGRGPIIRDCGGLLAVACGADDIAGGLFIDVPVNAVTGTANTLVYAATNLDKVPAGFNQLVNDPLGSAGMIGHGLGWDHPLENLQRGWQYLTSRPLREQASFWGGVVATAAGARGALPGPEVAPELGATTTPCDLICFGNAQGPYPPKLAHQTVGDDGLIVPNVRLGMSGWESLDAATGKVGGIAWKLPEGTELPHGLQVFRDNSPEGHWTFSPTAPMTFDQYQSLFQQISGWLRLPGRY